MGVKKFFGICCGSCQELGTYCVFTLFGRVGVNKLQLWNACLTIKIPSSQVKEVVNFLNNIYVYEFCKKHFPKIMKN